MKICLELDTNIEAEREIATKIRNADPLCIYIDGVRVRASPVDFTAPVSMDSRGRVFGMLCKTNLDGKVVS